MLEIFCSQGSIDLHWESRKTVGKGALLCNEKSDGKEKKIRVLLFFYTYSTYQISRSYL